MQWCTNAGGRLANLGGKNEESSGKEKDMTILGKIKKVELLPTRDREAGYAPGVMMLSAFLVFPN